MRGPVRHGGKAERRTKSGERSWLTTDISLRQQKAKIEVRLIYSITQAFFRETENKKFPACTSQQFHPQHACTTVQG